MITPYYDQDGITIYCGDCREILPQLDVKVDLVLTDPPYGINVLKTTYHPSKANKRWGNSATEKRGWDYSEWDDVRIPKETIKNLLTISSKMIIWGGNYYADWLPASGSWLVWDKDNGSNDFADCELAWTNLDTPVRKIKHRWNGMLQENMADKEYRYHPTQKPLPVIKWAALFLQDGLILDPFLGSGTTAVAAKILGRKCIGIEIEEKYCKIAVERLRQSVMRLDV